MLVLLTDAFNAIGLVAVVAGLVEIALLCRSIADPDAPLDPARSNHHAAWAGLLFGLGLLALSLAHYVKERP